MLSYSQNAFEKFENCKHTIDKNVNTFWLCQLVVRTAYSKKHSPLHLAIFDFGHPVRLAGVDLVSN